MLKSTWIVFASLILATALLSACKKTEPTPVEDPTTVEAQMQEEKEKETARRAEAGEALGKRLSEASASVEQLTAAGQGSGLPDEIAGAAAGVGSRLEEVRGLAAQLENATGDAWTTAHDRLKSAIADLESASSKAAASMAEWNQREQAALAARASAGSPIDPATGLLEGLDDGQYEPYLVSVVAEVQTRLRTLGLYAGPADGVFGAPLRAAIGSFQEQQELAVSGVPSPMTRSRLFAE